MYTGCEYLVLADATLKLNAQLELITGFDGAAC
jgi:hypothetical protein